MDERPKSTRFTDAELCDDEKIEEGSSTISYFYGDIGERQHPIQNPLVLEGSLKIIDVCRISQVKELPTSRNEKITMKSSLPASVVEQINPNSFLGTKKLNVSFHTIEIREYVQLLGDHPSVSNGPPLTIGWDYHCNDPIPIDIYEIKRGRPRMANELVMSTFLREKVLMNSGFSREEIAKAVREAKKIKSKRAKTVKNIKYQNAQYIAECLIRRLKNIFLFPWTREGNKLRLKQEALEVRNKLKDARK